MDIFSRTDSQVARYAITNSSGSKPATISIARENNSADNDAANNFLDACIITAIKDTKEVAHQVETTISGDVYINVFGDKPGQLFVEGIAFEGKQCPSIYGKRYENPGKTLRDFYREYRLNCDSGKAASEQVVLTTFNTVSGVPIKYVGILVSMVMDLTADQSGQAQYRFSFIFVSLE